MTDRARRDGIRTRIIRPGDALPDLSAADGLTPAERMAAVDELTRISWMWTRAGEDEPRLQRSVVRIQRPGR